MTSRFDYTDHAPGAYAAIDGLDRWISRCSLEGPLIDLVRLRASQLNGCAYCIDMHWKDLRAAGEPEHRLYALDAWRESPIYTERERAALAWTEAVTHVADGQVPDAVFESVRRQFSERELAELTVTVATINVWNRLSITARLVPEYAMEQVS